MISVLICTYNRGNLIGGTLHSLINRQIMIPDEIIVVNGGGKNDCKIILENWKNSFKNLKIIETENINLASSRNIGLKYCLGDIILLTDDDARPLPDWTLKIVEAHKKFPNAGAIGGNVINKNEMNFDLKSYIIKKIRNLGIKKIIFRSYDTFRDEKNFFSYRRSLLFKEKDYGRCISVISINNK